MKGNDMSPAQFSILFDFLSDWRRDQDKQMAMLINAVSAGNLGNDGEIPPCTYCGVLTCNIEKGEDNNNFCSESCKDDYIEDHEQNVTDEGLEIAVKKLKKFPKWENLLNEIDENGKPYSINGVKVIEYELVVVPDEAQATVIDDKRVYFAAADANYVLHCMCETCFALFDVDVVACMNSKKSLCAVCKLKK